MPGFLNRLTQFARSPRTYVANKIINNSINNLRKKVIIAANDISPMKYIGGNKNTSRDIFWKENPRVFYATDSIANRYGINPDLLRDRLDAEGFTDSAIKFNNELYKEGYNKNTKTHLKPKDKDYILNDTHFSGVGDFGLDDALTYLNNGTVKLINEGWYYDGPFENEKGRMTHPVNPVTGRAGIGIMAAHLKAFRDQAKEDFPKASDYDLDRYSGAYFNRGRKGGKRWVNAGAKGYNYKRRYLETNGKLSK